MKNGSTGNVIIYRLKLYALFIYWKNETALYRVICYMEVPFKAGLIVSYDLMVALKTTKIGIQRMKINSE